MKITLLLSVLFFSHFLLGQDKKEKAKDLMFEAVELVDAGKFEEGIKLLKQAELLDPENSDYPYEIAFAYSAMKKPKKAIKTLNAAMAKGMETSQYYQLLGNSYDESGSESKAIKTYSIGMEKYPNYGALYLERSIIELKKEKYNNAMVFLEKGIKQDPMYASNYYWASKIYLASKNEYMGMLYGEVFYILENNRKERLKEISTFLYEHYQSEIVFGEDSTSTDFVSNNIQITISDLSQLEDLTSVLDGLNYGEKEYSDYLKIALKDESKINLESLQTIRTKFINAYIANSDHIPNALYDYQKKLIDAGHFEAYNYLLLAYGEMDTFKLWLEDNQGKFDRVLEYLKENPIDLNSENCVHPDNLKIEE